MAKFGLFGGNVAQPMQTYEGDKMAQNGDHVYIYRKEKTASGDMKQVQVAAIKLDVGQSVKEIER